MALGITAGVASILSAIQGGSALATGAATTGGGAAKTVLPKVVGAGKNVLAGKEAAVLAAKEGAAKQVAKIPALEQVGTAATSRVDAAKQAIDWEARKKAVGEQLSAFRDPDVGQGGKEKYQAEPDQIFDDKEKAVLGALGQGLQQSFGEGNVEAAQIGEAAGAQQSQLQAEIEELERQKRGL